VTAPDPTHPRPAGLTARGVALNPAVLLFALLSFEWFTVAQVGGFSVRLPHLAVLLGIAMAAGAPRVVLAGAALLARWAPFVLPYALYLMILYLVLHATEARGMAVRQIFFLASFVVVGAWLAAAQDIRRVIRWAGAACLVVLVVGTELIARSIGSSWAEAVGRFVTRGDLDFVFYDFFRGIFNVTLDGGEDFVKASQKNAVAVAVLAAMFLLRAGGDPARRDVVGTGVTGLSLFLLLMLNSRSVLLVAGLGLGLVALLHVLRDWRPSVAGAVGAILAFVVAAAALTALFYTDNAMIAAIGERLAFEDDSAASRLDQYGWALQRIEGHLLLGGGYAELDGQPVHNLLLGALMHAGLAAFALVLAAYVSLLVFWVGFMRRLVTDPGWWVLPVRSEWIAALPLLPIVRVWLSGDAGHPGLAEWAALAAFFGVLQANVLRRAGLREASAGAPSP